MAQTPTPRSYSQILGDMIDAFLSRYGLRALKIGSPVLSMLESAAQSDLRNSEDIFTFLEAISLDQATGPALDRIGADEDLPRQTEAPTSGTVTVTDTSFVKIASKVFQGTAAPIAGSARVNVQDASLFTATGSVYIGRGTSNYEGPLAYTSILPPGTGAGTSGGNYYTLVLATGTLKFHNLGESVVLAQGGVRTAGAGSVVQTPQGNTSNAVQFKLLYQTQIQDGETEVDNVPVLALLPGLSGNVAANAINAFAAPPFTGASVTNPLPFTNGLAAESDDDYRERIRTARQTRTRGTALAIETFATGVTATDENKRVLSASLIDGIGTATTLYIDDGTGYEEVSSGIALESFVDEAVGGENFFQISSQPPVTKAFVLTTETAPFTLGSGYQLAFSVGGVTTVHSFNADEFRSIDNATAYEIVASINSDPDLNWSARTYANATQVAVYAKTDVNESIQLVAVTDGVDANAYLGFPAGRVDTMRLYKNDRLLYKDGAIATLSSNPVSAWGSLGSSEDLQLQVDGTPLSNLAGGTYTFTAADFVAAGTGYTSLGRNSAEAWAAVFNYRIPGITATVANGNVVLTSNRGLSGLASLAILGGSLVTKGMFSATTGTIFGANSDYVLDRNTGELRLAVPLAAGDKLAAGSTSTRAFLQTPAFSTIATTNVGHLYFVMDGNAQVIPTGLTASTPVTFSSTSYAGGFIERATVSASCFSSVAVGDWLIFWDVNAPSDIRYNYYRVTNVAADGSYVEWERYATTIPGSPVSFINSGLTVVRSAADIQTVVVPVNATYTAASVSTLLAGLVGVDVGTYETTRVRISTSTFSDVNGDIALVAADVDGAKLGLVPASATHNLTGHLGSVETGNSESGTPDFHQAFVVNGPNTGIAPNLDWTADALGRSPGSSWILTGLRNLPSATTLAGQRFGRKNYHSQQAQQVTPVSGNVYTVNVRSNIADMLQHQRLYFAHPYHIASDDQLTVLIDEDTDTGRFVIPFWRTIKPVGTTYSASQAYVDGDNGGQTLASGFGYTGGSFGPMAFDDFAVFMAARHKTHDLGDTSSAAGGTISDLNRTVLWRYTRLGADGNYAKINYQLPAAANSPVSLNINNVTDQYTYVGITLASGPARTGFNVGGSSPIFVATSGQNITYFTAYAVSSVTTTAGGPGTGSIQVTLTFPSTLTHSGIDLTGTQYWIQSMNANLPSGLYTFSAEAQVGGVGPYVVLTGAPVSVTIPASGTYANPGLLYVGTQVADFSGASLTQGDFFRIDASSSMPSDSVGYTIRVSNNPATTAYQVTGMTDHTLAATTSPQSGSLGDPSFLHAFQNLAQTVTAIVASVNAVPGTPIKGTVIGNGTGTVDRASFEEWGTVPFWYALSDGVNYVSTTTPATSPSNNYSLTFKNPVAASLATNSDWMNEVIRIVPRTAKNVSDWLNQATVSGLFSQADVELSSGGRKVQIVSLTPGSAGSVQVQGGGANEALAAVVGSAVVVGSQMVVTIAATDAVGFTAGGYVSVDNANLLPRSAPISASTALTSIAANGSNASESDITVSGTTWYTQIQAASSVLFNVERQGRFWCFTDTGLGTALVTTSVSEGDWVKLATVASPVYAGTGAAVNVAAGNTGMFRVVRVVASDSIQGGNSFWIENASGAEQALAEAAVQFIAADSVMVGDTITIGTSAWDGSASNQGTYVVADVGHGYTNAAVITVAAALSPRGSTAALGANYPRVQVVAGTPLRLIKEVLSISTNAADSAQLDLKFTTSALAGNVGAAAGSVLTALDKLDFSTNIVNGIDGYQHSTGLIAEVNKVIYGDSGDTATYPGVAAAGSSIAIAGPMVRRIQVTISIRIRTGASRDDIEASVKSAIAAVINKTPIGTSIALSDLVTAAGKVGGVISAVMVTPAATAGADLIAIQPNEKPLVLNVDQDVLVSFAGE